MYFDMDIINKQIDQLDFDLLNDKEKYLINQMNYTILIVSQDIFTQNYTDNISKQLINLLNSINQALCNIKYYNIYIVMYSVQVSLKLLYIFNDQKAQMIWNKFFINNITLEPWPLLLINEKKIENINLSASINDNIDDMELIVHAAEQLI